MLRAVRGAPFVATTALLAIGISGCSTAVSAEKELRNAVAATKLALANQGVVASFTEFDGSVAREVHDPAFGLYVNDATETGKGHDFKQISRNNQSSASAIDSTLNFVGAKLGAELWFAGTNYALKSANVTRSSNSVLLEKIMLKNLDDKKSVVSATLRFTLADGLITKVEISDNLNNKSNPPEVCQYYPTSCTKVVSLDYGSATVREVMAHAFAGYEASQIHGTKNIQNFEALARLMQTTAANMKSWTTLNPDGSVGTIYDAKLGRGSNWNPYDGGDKLTPKNVYTGWSGPDLNVFSQTFFDTTDGGSSFFYQDILVDHNTGTYSIKDSSGATAATFRFANNRLVAFSDSLDRFTVSPVADPRVLKNH
jgi:hypothetical protein